MELVKRKLRDDKKMTSRFKRFFQHLLWCTDVNFSQMKQIMHGANVQVNDDGRFYKLMCHDILTCERKRNNKTDNDCPMCDKIYNAYYEKASYLNGSSHKSWRDKDYPQYRLGKEGEKAVLVNLTSKNMEESDTFDFIIGLRRIHSKIYTWFQFEAEMGEDKLKSRKDLEALDKESSFSKTYNMLTKGHIASTLEYVVSGWNVGPFGYSSKNDESPINLKLGKCYGTNTFFTPVKEEDSVNYVGSTDCYNNKINNVELKF